MEKRTYLLMSGCLAAILLLGTIAHAQEANESKSTAAFTQLSSLVGEWTGVEDGFDVIVTYALIGDGSTLMEETRPIKGPGILTMTTMFSVDGDHLIATHYCDAKNQPQMASKPITDPNMKSFAFSLIRVTGMKAAPSDWHNTSVEISLDDKDHMTQKWTYVSVGKPGTNVFHLARKSA